MRIKVEVVLTLQSVNTSSHGRGGEGDMGLSLFPPCLLALSAAFLVVLYASVSNTDKMLTQLMHLFISLF